MTTPPNPFTRDEALALDARALDRALALPAPAAFAGEENDPMRRVEVKNGVGIVRVEGTLANDRWWCASYQDVVAEVGAALASPQVRAVVLALDSPGGTTSGLFDTMRRMRALKAQHGKRLCAWVASQATSAAYALASTCDEIVIDEMAGVGSIGVIAALMSRVGQLEQEGVDVRVVASGGEKTDGHPAVPITDAAVMRLKERVTMAAELLFAEVAASRPSLPVEQQKALDAGIRYGRQAVAAGLADRVGTLDALLASLAPNTNPYMAPRTGATATALTRMNNTMNEKLAALIAAKTGESDPERQYGALQALLDKAEKHDELAAKLAKIETDAETETFERTLKAGLDARKITDEEAVWWREERAAGRASARSLDANLARRVAPKLPAADPAHVGAKPPAAEAQTADPRLAALLAKPYGALTWDERNTLAALAPETFDRLNSAWVAAGRPRG